MYHYIRNLQESRYPQIKGMDITEFENQLDFIKNHYSLINMTDLCDKEKILPDNSAILTFDDGYLDHFTSVFPLLVKKGMQGVFFVAPQTFIEKKVLDVNKIHLLLATVSIDVLNARLVELLQKLQGKYNLLQTVDELWDLYAKQGKYDNKETIFFKRMLQVVLPLQMRKEILGILFNQFMDVSEDVIAQELYMTLDQMKLMKNQGMLFGIHGYSHMWMDHMNRNELITEIEKALSAMDSLVDKDNWMISYPYGGYTSETIKIVKELGGKIGVTVETRKVDVSNDNNLILPRLDANDLPPKSCNYLNIK